MRQIVLLRGINLGSRNRIAMPRLRDVLEAAGFADVATYVQSGNVVLESDVKSTRLAEQCTRLIASEFGLDIAVIERNPLGDVVDNPKRYQVSFLAEEPSSELVEKLAAAALDAERFVAIGRELYAWHPNGVARSKLWGRLAGRDLGIAATARNWTTVTALLALADA